MFVRIHAARPGLAVPGGIGRAGLSGAADRARFARGRPGARAMVAVLPRLPSLWRDHGRRYARMAGDALNVATALASVGGEAMKAWLIRRDVPYEESVPALVIAKTTATVAQALFLVLGIFVAFAVLPLDSTVVRTMLWLVVVEVLAVGGFVVVQVTGLVARGCRMLRWFGIDGATSHAE